MARGNKELPLTAYDPRLHELLVRGGRERVEIPCENATQRRALRNQLQKYRADAKKAAKEGWETLYRAKVMTPNNSLLLVVAPRGSEFDALFERASGAPVAQPTVPPGDDPLSDLPVTEPKG